MDFQGVESALLSTYQVTPVFSFCNSWEHASTLLAVTCELTQRSGLTAGITNFVKLNALPASGTTKSQRRAFTCSHCCEALASGMLQPAGHNVDMQAQALVLPKHTTNRYQHHALMLMRCRHFCTSAGCRDTYENAFLSAAQDTGQRLIFQRVPAHHVPLLTPYPPGWEGGPARRGAQCGNPN